MHSGQSVNRADSGVPEKSTFFPKIYGIKFVIGVCKQVRNFSAQSLFGSQGKVCVYLDGCVPLPVLRQLLVVRFLRLGLERLKLLLRHFYHSVLRFLQLSPFLSRAFSSPTHLQTAHNT